MPYIGKTPTVGNFQVCDAISVVNGQAAYTLQVGGVNVAPESANHMLVSLNGILQKPGSSFTISGSTMTFASNLATGDVIDFVQILGNVLDLGQPSDDTVTAAKLNNDVISGQTALTSSPDDTDELLISDAGTIKRIDVSLVGGKNTPTFLATMSALQTPSSASATLVNFDQTTYDTSSGYNTSAKKYVIPSAGYYHLYTCVNLYNSNNDLDRIILYLYVNGAVRFQTDSQPLNAASDFVYLGGVWNCSASDEITVQVYQVSGSGTGTIANDKSFFGAYKLIS